MNRIRRRVDGTYELTAAASDADGHPVAITSPAVVTITKPDGTTVVDAASASLIDGDMSYSLAVEDASELGVYHATWTGDIDGTAMTWDTEFELVTQAYYDLFAEAKVALRVSTPAFDGEISDLIDAARDKLALAGVSRAVLADPTPLVRRAIIVYCKAHFGLDNPEADRFDQSFESLAGLLAMGSEYKS